MSTALNVGSYVDAAGINRPVVGVMPIGEPVTVLASNIGAAGTYPSAAGVNVAGGDYLWTILAGGTYSAKLQILGPDGTTWVDFATARTASDTTSGGTGLGFGANAKVRIVITGTPTAFYSSLSRLP